VSASEVERAKLTEAIRRRLQASPEVAFAYLHGSFVTDAPYRDIDVAVWLDPERIPSSEWTRYALDLSASLHLELRVPVDVQVLNGAPVAFRYRAQTGQPLVVRDGDFLADFRARTWDEYFDFLPFARQYLREALGGTG
jgi:predicted nucleotidyltransferase